MSGIGDEMGDVGAAIERAEDKTAQMQARAGAIDELIASGALDDASSLNRGDDIARELEQMSSQSDVEAELARLKGLNAPGTSGAIEPGRSSAGDEVLLAEPEKVERPREEG
jgi:phage shock protein A